MSVIGKVGKYIPMYGIANMSVIIIYMALKTCWECC
jgi:hypothetical protein